MLSKFIIVTVAAMPLNVVAMGPNVGGEATIVRLTTSQLDRRIVRIVNREITRRARGLRVGSAIQADAAARADNATNAATAATANRANAANAADTANFATSSNSAASANVANFATSANPVIFAKVSADGVIDPAFSKGITQANIIPDETTGSYCFKGLPDVKGASVTTQTSPPGILTTGSFTMGAGGTNEAGPGCPDGTEFGITTRVVTDPTVDVGTSNPTNTDFYMVIYQ